jgi:hypothetical protein
MPIEKDQGIQIREIRGNRQNKNRQGTNAAAKEGIGHADAD